MHAQAEDTDDGVAQVEEEEHVHHDRFVASGERPLVPHETHKKDQLVEELMGKEIKEKEVLMSVEDGRGNTGVKSPITYIDSAQQQQSRTEAHGVDGTKDERDQEEEDAPRLR